MIISSHCPQRSSDGRRAPAAVVALALALALAAPPTPSVAARPQAGQAAPQHRQPSPKARTVAAGHRQVGLASYYGRKFAGRRMADGTRLRLDSDSAASKSLPLGTTARVRNLHNGRSAVVTIRDRGPHGRGRIIDVSPQVARRLGMVDSGLARVEVVVLRGPAAEPRRARRR